MTSKDFCLCVIISMFICAMGIQPTWADDDPNVFNQTMGISVLESGVLDTGNSCGWKVIATRNGTQEEGSDGGQLTISINTCIVFGYTIEQFPQIGGAGGTADLEPGNLIIVWDEDSGHGSSESYKNFSFTGTYSKLTESEYQDYLKLETTNYRTNWAVYEAETAGTFTKGSSGQNEHEVLTIDKDVITFWKEDDVSPDCLGVNTDLTYTINWYNDSGQTLENASIIDWLPDGVDYDPIISYDPPIIDPNYNLTDHAYRWELGDIPANYRATLR